MSKRLKTKNQNGRVYLTPEDNVMINQARMKAGYDATRLAMHLGLDRVKLNLICAGQDPIPSTILTRLESFLAEQRV